MTYAELYERINIDLNPEVPVLVSRGAGSNDWLCSKTVYSFRGYKERK
jgi:hypothetical protein